MDYKRYFAENLKINNIFSEKKKVLIIILGTFGDFDSLEYCQNISKYINQFKSLNLNLLVIGIGTKVSMSNFSIYTGLPLKYLDFIKDNRIHRDIDITKKTILPIGPIFNLLLMCSGINSEGTLQEVLRGYTGDAQSDSIFRENEKIKISPFLSFNSSIFNKARDSKTLRPFELATLRLCNMFEVLGKWNIYIPDNQYLLERGATFLFAEHGELIYSFFPKSLLSYSETMSRPLKFLEKHVNLKI